MASRLAALLEGLCPPSWRALAGFWLVVLALVGGTGLALAWLGPPEPRLAAGETATSAEPPSGPEPATTASPSGTPTPAAPIAPAATGASVPAATLTGAPGAAPPTPVRIPRADPALLEPGPFGPLPRIAPDGRSAMRAYARPFDQSERRPRIGVVLGGLGMNAALTEEAIRRLPPAVTLAFSPYATQIGVFQERARERSMEAMLALPLEPTGYPLNSPGDRALLTGLPVAENAERLDWALSRFTGYVGAIGALGAMRGERYAALGERLNALQDALHSRGLLYVDPRPGAAGPARVWGRAVDVVIDAPPNRAGIDRKLAELEQLAQERGTALGYVGEATPVLLERLAVWAGGLDSRGSVLAPVSALVRRPEATAAAR